MFTFFLEVGTPFFPRKVQSKRSTHTLSISEKEKVVGNSIGTYKTILTTWETQTKLEKVQIMDVCKLQ